MKIALAQINTIIGDFENNLKKVINFTKKAEESGADIIIFPELTFSGYPPRDLLEKKSFIEKNIEILHKYRKSVGEIGAVVGFISWNKNSIGKPIMNSGAFIHRGKIKKIFHKCLLPTYDVFDEARYFEPDKKAQGLISFKGKKLGLTICEDFWNEPEIFSHRLYNYDPVEDLANRGAEIFISIMASPYNVGKVVFRKKIYQTVAKKFGIPIAVVNLVGGNDDILFDGNSFSVDANGKIFSNGKDFEEDLIIVDFDLKKEIKRETSKSEEEEILKALTMGTRDYSHKCGFKSAVIGLSGGIDSALTAKIAADALGSENILGILMPSMYSSEGSISDSIKLAKNIGIKTETVPIKDIYYKYLEVLSPHFKGRKEDKTEENLQARIRGNILMSFSNKFGHLVLSTGNKSELAVGYSTLYGDMCGGLAVISDLLKTRVYKVANFINREVEIIPVEIIEKPPSAELRPGQKDQDELPPYEVLDPILSYYIEELLSPAEIIEKGYPEEIVKKVTVMVDKNEYKRRQAPPGLRITSKAFGYGRRLPIVQKFFLNEGK